MKRRLEELLKRLPVSRIIFGWGIRPGVAESFASSLRAISNANCEEAVLCWNVLHAPETNIRSIENALSGIM